MLQAEETENTKPSDVNRTRHLGNDEQLCLAEHRGTEWALRMEEPDG